MDTRLPRDPDRFVRGLFVRALVLFLVLGLVDAVVVGSIYLHWARRSSHRRVQQCGRKLADQLREAWQRGAGLEPVTLGRVIEKAIEQACPAGVRVRYVEARGKDGRPFWRAHVSPGGNAEVSVPSFLPVGSPEDPDSPPRGITGNEDGETAEESGGNVREYDLDAGKTLRVGMEPVEPGGDGWMEDEQVKELMAGAVVSLLLLVVAFLYVLRLVHRTRRLEAATQRARHLAYLGTLASGLAHEIRNPLNAMNINLQMLEEELVEAGVTGETLDLLRSSREEVQRLERLVKDFLAYARPQPTDRKELSPVELVGDVVRFLRPQFEERGVGLELENEEGTPTVRVDPGQVRQAVINILQNALEASPAETTVTVTVGPTDRGEARIDVRDRGKGIDPGNLAHIFDVFWSEKPAGSGLGLPIAQRVVEAHGGRIEVESTPGAGSLFRIILPPAVSGDAVLPDPA